MPLLVLLLLFLTRQLVYSFATMSTMLRPALRKSMLNRASVRRMGTQSTDKDLAPTATATLHLEDGSKLVGTSFGSHESVDGEVRQEVSLFVLFDEC